MWEQRGGGRIRSRRNVLKALGTAGAVGLAGCIGGEEEVADNGETDTTPAGGGTIGGNDETETTQGTEQQLADEMTIFHAGSLAAPFEQVEPEFEDKYGVQVTREPKGSVASTKKITQQGRTASVLGVSDYRLLRDRLLPDFGDWYAIFATNAMTIAYTENSTGAGEIGTDNWWEILLRDDVRYAHSDPAIDPNGYRSVMTMKLGAVPFEGSTLYDEQTAQTLIKEAAIPTGTESQLIAQLQTGKLDYAFEYQSAGATHPVKTVDLQPSVDLSKATEAYAKHYSKVEVETDSGTFTGAPIAYGITVPSVATAPKLGARWVEFVTEDEGTGEQILKESGFVPVNPAVVPTDTKGNVPERVMENAVAKENLGPLDL